MSFVIVNFKPQGYVVHFIEKKHLIVWDSSYYLPQYLLSINGESEFVDLAHRNKFLEPKRKYSTYYRMVIYPLIYQLEFLQLRSSKTITITL